MSGKTLARVLGILAIFVAALMVLRLKPWQQRAADNANERLRVGFLPVT
jgi:hypothetical protein